MTDNKEELFPIVSETGETIGRATRAACHSGSRLLHPVVHLHVLNSRGELFLQLRPAWKDIQPNRWDTACGGHVAYGETVEQALEREVQEELGITCYSPTEIARYAYDSVRERELVCVNLTIYNDALHPSAEELNGGRFWSIEEIRNNIGKQVFTPNFESEFKQIVLPSLSSATLIRQAVPSDAPLIAELIMTALGQDLCLFLQGPDHTREQLHQLFTLMSCRDDTQYSYRNALLAEQGGQVAGLALSYDGSLLPELRPVFIQAMREHFGRELELVDETQAGELYLDSFAVREPFRKQGIGSALLRATLRKTRLLHLPELGLLVDIDNIRAQRVYAAAGFKQRDSRPFGNHYMYHLTQPVQ